MALTQWAAGFSLHPYNLSPPENTNLCYLLSVSIWAFPALIREICEIRWYTNLRPSLFGILLHSILFYSILFQDGSIMKFSPSNSFQLGKATSCFKLRPKLLLKTPKVSRKLLIFCNCWPKDCKGWLVSWLIG